VCHYNCSQIRILYEPLSYLRHLWALYNVGLRLWLWLSVFDFTKVSRDASPESNSELLYNYTLKFWFRRQQYSIAAVRKGIIVRFLYGTWCLVSSFYDNGVEFNANVCICFVNDLILVHESSGIERTSYPHVLYPPWILYSLYGVHVKQGTQQTINLYVIIILKI